MSYNSMHINLCNYTVVSDMFPFKNFKNVSCTCGWNWNVCHTVCKGSRDFSEEK